MTHRGGKEASLRRRGIGDDERQPVMVQLVTQWRCFNLMKLIMLKKENHQGEA